MDINLIIRYQIITILSVHTIKKTLKITNTWMNYPTKTKNTRNIKKKGIYESKLE